VKIDFLMIAEQVGLVGPASRAGDTHAAAVRFGKALLNAHRAGMLPSPEESEWKNAMLDGLAAYATDMPTTASPREILAHIVSTAVGMALDPAISDLEAPEVEPVAFLVEGMHDGKLISHALYFTVDEAKNTASVFSQHYPTVNTKPLYLTPEAKQPVKDHEVAALVNRLRDIAIEFHGTQQLRERIAHEIRPLFPANRLSSIVEALEVPGCERIKDFYQVGPVQRAAVESFATALGHGEPVNQMLLEALKAQHADRRAYSIAQRRANATCGSFTPSNLAALIESGYMQGLGKQTEAAITAAEQAPHSSKHEGAQQLANLNGEIAADLKGEVLQLRAELERKSNAIQRLWKERDELRSQLTADSANVPETSFGNMKPLTTEQYTALAHRMCSRYRHDSHPAYIEYTFQRHTLEDFVRAIEHANSINPTAQQSPQP